MARLEKGSAFQGLKGQLGKEIVIKQYVEKVVVTKYPDMSDIEPSEKQKEQRNLMKQANAYARKAKTDPELRAYYEMILNQGNLYFIKPKRIFLTDIEKTRVWLMQPNKCF